MKGWVPAAEWPEGLGGARACDFRGEEASCHWPVAGSGVTELTLNDLPSVVVEGELLWGRTRG